MTRSFGGEERSLFLRETLEPSAVSFTGRSEPLEPSTSGELRSEGYDEYFEPPLESKYECPICLLGLREPVQTTCGHRFCRGCILRSIREFDRICPICNEELDELKLFADNFAKKEILHHNVFCHFKESHGCTWKGPLEEMKIHDQNCSHYPLLCENCGKENISRNKMQEHIEKDCPRAEIKCPFSTVGCSFEGPRPAVNTHVTEQLNSHLIDMTKAFAALKADQSGELEIAPRNQIRRTRLGAEAFPQEQASHDVFVNDLATLCQQQRAEIDEMRQLVTALNSSVQHLERRLEDTRIRVERPVQELTVRFNRVETKVLEYEGRVCNGSYIWRIENYRQCRQDAMNGVMTAIQSPAFHTSLYGYKLCMRINLNGVDSGVGRFVALSVHMMKGDYDNILEWPFTGRIALSILDQRDGVEFRQHISETLVAKPNLLAFQRPTAPCNDKGYDLVEFAPIEQIREPQYVKNNTMLVHIQIFQ
ncbi:TNF receptor-associated factor 6-like [Montipora foliosa]|uniref:TNF receptor-associated factor 6-like n=1 Tax=Montipora foliosa TaxID=591990 RepID=UPI0035F0FDFE